jgi:hypothetical protein
MSCLVCRFIAVIVHLLCRTASILRIVARNGRVSQTGATRRIMPIMFVPSLADAWDDGRRRPEIAEHHTCHPHIGEIPYHGSRPESCVGSLFSKKGFDRPSGSISIPQREVELIHADSQAGTQIPLSLLAYDRPAGWAPLCVKSLVVSLPSPWPGRQSHLCVRSVRDFHAKRGPIWHSRASFRAW